MSQPDKPDPHANCQSVAGKEVTCDRCGDTYVCTPQRDHYCAAEGDHCCEPCLLSGKALKDKPLVKLTVVTGVAVYPRRT